MEDFIVVKTLGIGTFGKVKLVYYRKRYQKIPFALKILKKREIINQS